MEFERARSREHVLERKKEILNACARLFDEYGFDGVNFKAIGALTSFTRPAIYKYYSSKEEILLDLFTQDLKLWDMDIQVMITSNETMDKDTYAKALTETFMRHQRLLKLLSILFSSLEKNCSLEKLITFKKDMHTHTFNFILSLEKFFPDASEEQRGQFMTTAISLVLGLYPYTHLSDRQIEAIKKSGVQHITPDFETILSNGLKLLLSDL